MYIDPVLFPDELSKYGLTIEVLTNAFGGGEVSWSMQEIPIVQFYRKLHQFLMLPKLQ